MLVDPDLANIHLTGCTASLQMSKLLNTPPDRSESFRAVVSSTWIGQWLKYVDGCRPHNAPGPINNDDITEGDD